MKATPSVLLALVVAVAACGPVAEGDGTPGAQTSRGASIRSEAEYATLPLLHLTDLGPVCLDEAEACLIGPSSVASVSRRGDVLFVGTVSNRPQVFRVAPGARAVPLGRSGAGPGEYKVPSALGFSPADDALILALDERRLLTYSPDGELVAMSRVPRPPTFFGSVSFVDGEIRALATEVAESAGDSMPVLMLALDSGAAEPRRLYGTSLKEPAIALGQFRSMSLPFAPKTLWKIRPDGGLIRSTGDRLVFALYDPAGRPVGSTGFLVRPRAVTAAELESAITTAMRFVPDERMRGAMEERWRRGAAKHHPAITQIVSVSDGRVWVRESPNAEADSVSWVVFRSDGRAVGRVLMGTGETVLAALGDSILMAVDWNPTSPGALHWVGVEKP